MKLYWVDENAYELVDDALANGEDINAFLSADGEFYQTMLFKAVSTDNCKMAAYLLDLGADIQCGEKNMGLSPLYQAVYNAQPEMARLLLDAGADINVGRANNATPLKMAVSNGDVDLARLLLERGADPDIADSDGYTPLISAANKGNVEMVRLLLHHRANPNCVTHEGHCALGRALIHQDETIALDLVAAGADPNLSDKTGETPFKMACKLQRVSLLPVLVNAGADINAQDDDGYTPLISAVFKERDEVVSFLLERGAKLNVGSKDGWTALTAAMGRGRGDYLEQLIDAGADLNLKREIGWSPLSTAIKKRRLDYMKTLLDAGANPNINGIVNFAAQEDYPEGLALLLESGANPNGSEGLLHPPLFYAVHHSRLLPILLKYPLNFNVKNKSGDLLLNYAVWFGAGEFCKTILDTGKVNINETDSHNQTALFYAVKQQNLKLVDLLIAHGANVNYQRTDGLTSFQLAVLKGNVDLIQKLLAVGADPYLTKTGGVCMTSHPMVQNNPEILRVMLPYLKQQPEKWQKEHIRLVSIALQYGKREIFDLLLDGQDINTATLCNKPLVQIGVWWKNKIFVERLLDWGAAVDTPDQKGRTPLVNAFFNDDVEMVRLLLERGANPNERFGGFPLIARIAYNGSMETAQAFLKASVDLEAKSLTGSTALFCAIEGGHLPMVRLLLDKGARVNVKNKRQQTPLQTALQHNQPEMAALLLAAGATDVPKQIGAQPARVAANDTVRQRAQ